MFQLYYFVLFFILSSTAIAACQHQRVQVLGSGGPELSDGRASSSYLVWLDNKGVVLIDAGSCHLQKLLKLLGKQVLKN